MIHDIYDIETYPNVITYASTRYETGEQFYFEISEYRNDLQALINHLYGLKVNGVRQVGYNNIHFDYPVIHFIIECAAAWSQLAPLQIVALIYEKSQSIFNAVNYFAHMIWDNQRHIKQIDLLKIHHFDNFAKSTSLKTLQFNMQSISVEDLPFPPGTWLTFDQIIVLAQYNKHDVSETLAFFIHTLSQIEFRYELSAKYNSDYMSHNDTKIGKDYIIMKLEENAPGTCYTRDANNKRQPRQTPRSSMFLGDLVFPYVQFMNPEFNRILNHFKTTTITQTKGAFDDLSCLVDGLKYVFGTGGLHASMHGCTVASDSDRVLIDLDVTSYYPSLAIANRVYPEHLGEIFCDIYLEVFQERMRYDKKSTQSAMLKLALNGVYGDSNQVHSVFYDPAYTMTITINGQLLLCMLADHLRLIPGLEIIQANTDGVTVRVDRDKVSMVDHVRDEWEKMTCLGLEDVNYSRMIIRDVNNYIGVYEDGTTKRIGAYKHETARENPSTREVQWHKNHSALIVPKAAEAVLVHGEDLDSYIMSPDRDIMDFMLGTKTKRSDTLVTIDAAGVETEQQRVTRYYIAKRGYTMMKIGPPVEPFQVGMFKKANGVTNEQYFTYYNTYGNVWNEAIHTKNHSTYVIRRTGVDVGWLVETCNDIRTVNGSNINYDYYITEARKLIDAVKVVK